MVAEIEQVAGVRSSRVLDAMRTVPRHEFVPQAARDRAYKNIALDIGHGATISPPYIVAIMAEQARLTPESSVLEIGTGSGYGAAVLARLARKVYTIEIVEELGKAARERLKRLGADNVEVKIGDGYRGWPEHAPFDAILVTAAPPEIPQALKDQLKVGGRMVIPVGERYPRLRVLTKTKDGFSEREILQERFDPMTGEVADK